jgi:ABC-type methionine transport system permease subunit
MVITAMCFENGIIPVFSYLFVLWVMYFFSVLFAKKTVQAYLLALFIGFPLGLLFACDAMHIQIPFARQIYILSRLPVNILGYLSLGFFAIFAAVIPFTSSVAAKALRKKYQVRGEEGGRRHI